MHLSARKIGASLLLAFLLTGGARAMSVHDFSKLNDDDEAGFVTYLVEASAHFLKTQGHPDQADKVIAFFNETGKAGGAQQFAGQLHDIDAQNKRNAIKPSNTLTPFQVEDAMSLTLKDIGVTVPAKYLLSIANDFHASGPPRQH